MERFAASRRPTYFTLFTTVAPTILSLLVGISGSGCSQQNNPELVVISPHSPEIREEFSRGFSNWHRIHKGTPANVRWLDVGGTGEAIEYIRSRNAATGSAGGVDVFFGGGDFPFIKLAAENLLENPEVPDSIRDRIPSHIGTMPVYDSLWFGAALSGFGIVCNKFIADQNGLALPNSWRDLASRSCRGWVASGDPRYSGSIHVMYEILLQAYGWEKGWDIITRMGANVQTFTKGAGTAAKDVSIGQAAFGLAIDFYAFTEIQRYGSKRLSFVLPAQATVINADGIAILKGGQAPKLAHEFLQYVLTEGQKLWILNPGVPGGPLKHALCRFPVDSSLYSLPRSIRSVDSNPYDLPLSFDYNGRVAGKRWAILGDMIAAFVITPHEELKACWREVIQRGLTPSQYAQYFALELSEQEVDLLSSQWSTNEFARTRVVLMNQWTRRAIERYRSVYADPILAAQECDPGAMLLESGQAAASGEAPQ